MRWRSIHLSSKDEQITSNSSESYLSLHREDHYKIRCGARKDLILISEGLRHLQNEVRKKRILRSESNYRQRDEQKYHRIRGGAKSHRLLRNEDNYHLRNVKINHSFNGNIALRFNLCFSQFDCRFPLIKPISSVFVAIATSEFTGISRMYKQISHTIQIAAIIIPLVVDSIDSSGFVADKRKIFSIHRIIGKYARERSPPFVESISAHLLDNLV